MYNYLYCLESYQACDISTADFFGCVALGFLPSFVTAEFLIQHRRRLYTKDRSFYKEFAVYGESWENWYIVDGKLLKYKEGKLQNR